MVDDEVKAYHAVDFERRAFLGIYPALDDLDGDGAADIAFATQDRLYLLQVNADTGRPQTSFEGDTLQFDVIVKTEAVGEVADSSVDINAMAAVNGAAPVTVVQNETDESNLRVIDGVSGDLIDRADVSESTMGSLDAARIVQAQINKNR